MSRNPEMTCIAGILKMNTGTTKNTIKYAALLKTILNKDIRFWEGVFLFNN